MEVDRPEEEIRLQGAPVSEGIAIGIPYFLSAHFEEIVPEFPITISEVDDEIARYRRALFSSREDLERLQQDLEIEGSLDAIQIIDAHIQMLDDPLMTTLVEERIRVMRQNTESVFTIVIKELKGRFSETKDSFFQQRLIDVMDLSKRILGHLCSNQRTAFADIPPNSVVFAKELEPSETAAVQASRVSAFVTQSGGGSSHAALIARSKGIPYVSSIDMNELEKARGQMVIVDGLTGDIIVNPSENTLEKYRELKKRLNSHLRLLEKEVGLKAETRDGYQVHLLANVGSLADIEALHQYGGVGVGLLRSEFFFFDRAKFFSSEEEQYNLYREAIALARGLPLTIRVFDIGSDKYPGLFPQSVKEINPVLGCRGIRFLLQYKSIFRVHLRAILKASIEGNIRILLPLIADLNELREANKILLETQKELENEGFIFKNPIPVGIMIEVPSAVWICDLLLQESDFLSLGTNDLEQFSLGVERSETGKGDYYFPIHPSLIRMIKMLVFAAKKHNKPMTLCGEMASNPILIPLFLGLGIQAFSSAPRYIPMIKRVVRNICLVDAYAIAEKAMSLKTASEISGYLLEEYQKIIPD